MKASSHVITSVVPGYTQYKMSDSQIASPNGRGKNGNEMPKANHTDKRTCGFCLAMSLCSVLSFTMSYRQPSEQSAVVSQAEGLLDALGKRGPVQIASANWPT